MTDLKPCPFCGGEAEAVHEINGFWTVECIECGALVDGIAAWNARAERTCRCTTDDNAWCFACSECGKTFPRSRLHYAHNHGEINYCPNCGAKVVDA